MVKFSLGQTVITQGVNMLMEEGSLSKTEVNKMFLDHATGEWGELTKTDQKMNEKAIKDGDRILSKYTKNGYEFYVITEADRSVTTVLLTDEY